jgi:hypothetical protein
MTVRDNTLDLIISHGLTVRQIPNEVISHWGHREGAPIVKNSEIVTIDGRVFQKTVKIPEHAGKWMAKKCKNTSSNVHWNIKEDCLSDTLQNAVLKAVEKLQLT